MADPEPALVGYNPGRAVKPMEVPLRGRVLPLLVADSVDAARRAGHAIFAAGITCVEVALRTPSAPAAAEALIADGELEVALGTVTEPVHVELAARIGARFVVSPGFFPDVVAASHELGVPAVPGVATPTEAIAAAKRGATLLKVYPVKHLGGVAFVDALAAVTPDVRFMPSGGVSAENAAEYLGHPDVAAVSGSWMVPKHLVDALDAEAISRLCRQALEAAR